MRAIRLLIVVLVCGLAAVGSGGARAAEDSRLLSAGFPELKITISNDDIDVPGIVPAGRTLIAYRNTGDELRQSWLVRIPDSVSAQEIAAPVPPGEPPAWFMDGTFVGFPGAVAPGKVTYAVVDLLPGLYAVYDDMSALFTVVDGSPATPAAAAEPHADAAITEYEYGFGIPDTVAAGDVVWKVTNSGAQVHELILSKSPAPITKDQILALLQGGDPNAHPAGGGPSLNDLEAREVTGFGALSPGMSGWTELDLEPGTYVAVCFVPGMDGVPHVAEGMIQVFIVV